MHTGLSFTPLDVRTWERGEVFYYFSQMAPTGYSLTTAWNVTHLLGVLKSVGRKFFPAYLWLVTKTLQRQKEFKLAQVEGQLGYYQGLTPLYATFHPEDHTFSLLWTEFHDDFPTFYAAYEEDQARYGSQKGILAKKGMLPPPNAYTVSCVPWISFQYFAVHSYAQKPYYFPSVEAGKFYTKGTQKLLPLSLTCHHAAVDGWHVSRFLETLQAESDAFEKYI